MVLALDMEGGGVAFSSAVQACPNAEKAVGRVPGGLNARLFFWPHLRIALPGFHLVLKLPEPSFLTESRWD